MAAARDKLFFASLALRHAKGIGPRTWKRLLEAYPDPFEAVQAAGEWAGRGLVSPAVPKDFKAETWRSGAEEEYRAARRLGWEAMLLTDPDFPAHLRHIQDPPLVLYLKGRRELIRHPGVAVVGARNCSRRGLDATRRISAGLSSYGVTVVSGMASGIDRQAHLGALTGPGLTVAVMGTGPDRIFPASNTDLFRTICDQGLVVTEFSPGAGPERGHFPFRNRIISGLSLGVLVAEAPGRSGALITARLAGDQGREVFALPGMADDPRYQGCLELIRQGAELVRSADEIVLSLREGLLAQLPDLDDRLADPPESDGAAPAKPSAPEPAPDPDGAAVLALMEQAGRVHIDEAVRSLGWDAARVSRALLALELLGLVRRDPGMYYRRA